MKNFLTAILLCSVLALAAACDDGGKDGKPSAGAPEPVEKRAEVIADRLAAWGGQWEGIGGASLTIERSGDGYGVTIRSADKEERYLGVAMPDVMQIRFRRADTDETIHMGGGFDTGIPELKKKPYCLIVKSGEAYCRDQL